MIYINFFVTLEKHIKCIYLNLHFYQWLTNHFSFWGSKRSKSSKSKCMLQWLHFLLVLITETRHFLSGVFCMSLKVLVSRCFCPVALCLTSPILETFISAFPLLSLSSAYLQALREDIINTIQTSLQLVYLAEQNTSRNNWNCKRGKLLLVESWFFYLPSSKLYLSYLKG